MKLACEIKIENNLPAGFVSQAATSTISNLTAGSIIFALVIMALIIFVYWRYRNNGGGGQV